MILLTDQIPVWLKVEAGQQLVSERRLSALRSGKKLRQARRKAAAKKLAASVARKQPAQAEDQAEEETEEDLPAEPAGEQGESYLIKGPGKTSASRSRVSLLARQAVKHFWNPDKVPEGHHGRIRCMFSVFFFGFVYTYIHTHLLATTSYLLATTY